MDPIQVLLSWQLITFSLSVVAIVFVLKTISEYIISTITKSNPQSSKLWNDLILPILPILIGMVVGFLFVSFPYPDGLVSSSGRFIFGSVSGLLSTTVYRYVKAAIATKSSSILSTSSTLSNQMPPRAQQ
jgi:hypothetical protein